MNEVEVLTMSEAWKRLTNKYPVGKIVAFVILAIMFLRMGSLFGGWLIENAAEDSRLTRMCVQQFNTLHHVTIDGVTFCTIGVRPKIYKQLVLEDENK